MTKPHDVKHALWPKPLQVSVDAAVNAPGQAVQQLNRQQLRHSSAAQQQGKAEAGAAPAEAQTAGADAASSSTTDPEPRLGAAQAEVTWLRRRYGSGLQLHRPAELEAAQQDAALPAAAERQHTGQQRAVEQSVQSFQPGDIELSVSLTPTDPAWDRVSLRLRIRLDGSFPAAGSIAVLSVEPCQEAGGGSSTGSGADGSNAKAASGSADQLSAGAAEVLAKLLTAQAASDARRPAPLKALVRSVENNAAQFAQQVQHSMQLGNFELLYAMCITSDNESTDHSSLIDTSLTLHDALWLMCQLRECRQRTCSSRCSADAKLQEQHSLRAVSRGEPALPATARQPAPAPQSQAVAVRALRQVMLSRTPVQLRHRPRQQCSSKHFLLAAQSGTASGGPA